MGNWWFKLHGPGEAKRSEGWEPRFTGQQASGDLQPSSGASDPGEAGNAAKSRAPATAAERLAPRTTFLIPPLPLRNRARASWGVAAALSPLPSAGSPPRRGGPLPQSRGAGSPMGAWRGRAPASPLGGLEDVSVAGAPWEGPRALHLPAPHTKAPTEAPHLPAREGSGRRRAGGQAGGRMCARECACVPVCVCASVCVRLCEGDLAELCASACAGASVRRSVCPALSPALRARSLFRSPHQMRFGCGVSGAAARSAPRP